MAWYVTLLIYVATTIIGELLRPKPQLNHAKPAGLGDFRFPTASEGRPVPVVWGTVETKSPNLIWYGDYRVQPLTKKVRTGLFSRKRVTTGHRYHVGLHLGLCHAGTTLLGIKADEVSLWTGSLTSGPLVVNLPEAFGGEEREGGMQGTFTLLPGSASQTANPYLAAKIEGLVPAYRGITSVVWEGGYVGTTPHLKALSFQLRRLPMALGSGKHDIAGDANPAEMLYEALTHTAWGMGAPVSLIDTASFLAAANTLHAEGFGLSLLWDNTRNIEDILGEILRHIDGVIYTNIRTGRYELALARGGVDPATLPVLDPGNVLELINYSRGAWDETTNEVKVTYTDRAAAFTTRTAQAQDLANWQIQGGLVSTTLRYDGVTNATLAARLAMRDLKALTLPMAKCTLRTNRSAWSLKPGGLFRFTWPPLGIENLVMRINRVAYGELTRGVMEITAVEDVFALGDAVYAPVPPTGWQPVTSLPANATLVAVHEAPGALAVSLAGSWETARPLIAAARPVGDAYGYDFLTRQGSDPYALVESEAEWTPTAVLAADYPATTAAVDTSGTLIIASGIDLERLTNATASQVRDSGDNLFLLGAELCAFESITANPDGTHTLTGVWRGLLDTVPAAHPAGARLWFIGASFASTERDYGPTQSLNAKLLTRTARGILAEALATQHSLTFASRARRPYPPGDAKVNGVTEPAFITGALALSWAHRDRTQQTTSLITQAGASIGPEAGVTYTLRLYGETGTLRRTVSGLTGTTYTYPIATEIADSGLNRANESLRVEVESLREGLASWQFHARFISECRGYGMFYGDYYGE